MATKSVLKCKYGMGENKTKTKSYNMKPSATDEDAVAVAGLINGLQTKEVLGLYRMDTKEIV